jgi:hypothetical protein
MATMAKIHKDILRDQVMKSIFVEYPSGEASLVPENIFDEYIVHIAQDKDLGMRTAQEVNRYRKEDLQKGNRIRVILMNGKSAVTQMSASQIVKLFKTVSK